MRNVIILGMHRSGTSMVAEALAAGGIYVGEADDLLRSQEDNPHGFWEREDMVALNDAILAHNHATWFKPPLGTPSSDSRQTAQMSALVSAMPGDCSWLLKDPRQVVTWPLWRDLLPDVVLVYVYRDPIAVAVSLQRRNGFPLSLGILLWEYYNRLAIDALQGHDVISLSYEQVASNPREVLSGVLARLGELGVRCDAALKPDTFDDALGRSATVTGEDKRGLLTESQLGLASYCEALVSGENLPALPPAAPAMWSRLSDLADALAPLATVVETRNQLTEMTALCEERTQERDESLSQFRTLDKQHKSLAKAHKQEKSLHRRLEKQHIALDQQHHELADSYRAQVVVNENLEKELEIKVSSLTRTYSSLLHFELSSLAGIWRNVARIYKIISRRHGLNTRYDDALDLVRAYYIENDLELPQKQPGKFSLLGDVVRYVFETPAGSARSFSISRLRRALTVFFRSSPDDLEVWVNSRFPEREEAGGEFDSTSLDPDLDILELQFPAVETPLISIIIPVYNDYRVTMNCLQALLQNTPEIAYEVIIADDCSTDLTKTITDRVANIRVVRGDENLRFIGNCNRAAVHARGDHLLFLNNDTAVCPDWLQPLLDLMNADPTVGIVGPRLLFGDGKLQEAGAIMWRDGSAWNYGRMDNLDKPEFNYVRETDYISGACLMIRSALWEQLGGFDTRFAPAYYEDADIAFAARKAGYRVLYQPLSRVFHFEGVSNGTDLASGVKQYQVRNQQVFRDKWAQELDAFHFDNAQHVFLARDRSRKKRTVLYIDHYVPHFDKDAGSRSTFMWLSQMVEMGYRVLFMGANFFPHKPYTEKLQQMGVEVLVGEYMARNQDRWLKENAPYLDAIYLHRPHVAEQFLGSLEKMEPKPSVIFMGHDLHYLRISREYALSGDESLEKSSRKWRKREFAVFERVDTIYYPSSVEIEEIKASDPGLNARAVPLYILPETESPNYSFSDTSDILFVGGFNHPPNVDGIGWFVEQVLPLVRAVRPEIRLHIVGSNTTEAVEALQGDQVTVYGYLSDKELGKLYKRVRQVVVPLRYGAGVKGKVLEAIQKNRPLVTTTVGAEGIPEADSVMNIADSAEAFAELVVKIDQGDSKALERMSGYPQWLQRHFSQSNAASIIEQDFGSPIRDNDFSDAPVDTDGLTAAQ